MRKKMGTIMVTLLLCMTPWIGCVETEGDTSALELDMLLRLIEYYQKQQNQQK